MKKNFKKYDLLIIMGIILALYTVLSYIIPVGDYSTGTFVQGEVNPLGIAGILDSPTYAAGIFVQYTIVLLLIGGLYAVMSKTGIYTKIIDKIVKAFNKKKKLFLVLSISVFAILASIFNLPLVLFALVPLVFSVIVLLGFSKVTALVSTVGAISVGLIGSTYGMGIINLSFFNIDPNNSILYKFIFLAMLIALLVICVFQNVKKSEVVETSKSKKKTKETKNEEIEIPFYQKGTSKRSSLPLIIIFILFFVISILGMFNWNYVFGIDIFDNLATITSEFKIGGIPILSKILGTFIPLGNWDNYNFATLILTTTLLIGWLYSIKPSELFDTIFEGFKKMLKTALYVSLSTIIFGIMIQVYQSGAGTINTTINHFLLSLSDKFNVLVSALGGVIGGIFYNDFPYFLRDIYVGLSTFDANTLPVVSMVYSAAHGLVMMALPLGITLVAGLKLFDVSYKDWIKYIWKLLLWIFIGIIIIGLLLVH